MKSNNGKRQLHEVLMDIFKRLAVLVLIACIVLFFSDTNAVAENGSNVDKSNYAYTGGNYAGIDRAAKSVFYVGIYNSENVCFASGSGFVMFSEGLFVTNQHVINGASYLLIVDDDGRQYKIDQVIVSDAEHDIAILSFPEGRDYQPLEYDTSFDQLKRGQSVLTIGSPKGLPGTVSDGIISAFPKFKDEDIRYIQITAPISHGSSGGCLLNEDLKVIGVTSAGMDEGENLGFAIPVFIVEQLYSQWNKTDTVSLGTEIAWDTVGHGLHNRISGTAERPTIQEGSGNTITGQTPAQQADVYIDMVEDAGRTDNAGNPLYALTINGKKLEWDQTVEAAVQFCNQNGLKMRDYTYEPYYEGFSLGDQKIVFFGSIKIDELYICPEDTPDIDFIGMFICNTQNDPDTAIQCALDVYQVLQQRFGDPTSGLLIIDGWNWNDAQTDDMAVAIEKVMQLEASEIGSGVYAIFGNMFFAFSRSYDYGDEFYQVSIEFAPTSINSPV